MKKIMILFILGILVNIGFAQACGVYQLRYIARMETKSLMVQRVELPSVSYFHGLEKKRSANAWVGVEPMDNNIDHLTYSPLTSHLFATADDLLAFFKSNLPVIPLTCVVLNENKEAKIRTELNWENVHVSRIENPEGTLLFELNLGVIRI